MPTRIFFLILIIGSCYGEVEGCEKKGEGLDGTISLSDAATAGEVMGTSALKASDGMKIAAGIICRHWLFSHILDSDPLCLKHSQ